MVLSSKKTGETLRSDPSKTSPPLLFLQGPRNFGLACLLPILPKLRLHFSLRVSEVATVRDGEFHPAQVCALPRLGPFLSLPRSPSHPPLPSPWHSIYSLGRVASLPLQPQLPRQRRRPFSLRDPRGGPAPVSQGWRVGRGAESLRSCPLRHFALCGRAGPFPGRRMEGLKARAAPAAGAGTHLLWGRGSVYNYCPPPRQRRQPGDRPRWRWRRGRDNRCRTAASAAAEQAG